MIRALHSALPEFIRRRLRKFRNDLRALSCYGTGRWCPVCEKPSRRFLPFGVIPREQGQCVHCGSLERHRFVWMYFKQRTDLFDGRSKVVLHVAPEKCFESRLKRRLGKGYITADLLDRRAMVKMDITDIQYPEDSFDVIYCSHVLEHVHDDKKAMREFRRVLKRGGLGRAARANLGGDHI